MGRASTPLSPDLRLSEFAPDLAEAEAATREYIKSARQAAVDEQRRVAHEREEAHTAMLMQMREAARERQIEAKVQALLKGERPVPLPPPEKMAGYSIEWLGTGSSYGGRSFGSASSYGGASFYSHPLDRPHPSHPYPYR